MKPVSIATVLFAVIVVLSLDFGMLRLSVPPRRPTSEALARRADPNPQLAAFLAGVRERTRRGDSIVVVLPDVLYREREAYLYRAKYHLAGRDVFLADDPGRATWAAAWRVPVSGRVVWAGDGGVLVRLR